MENELASLVADILRLRKQQSIFAWIMILLFFISCAILIVLDNIFGIIQFVSFGVFMFAAAVSYIGPKRRKHNCLSAELNKRISHSSDASVHQNRGER